MMVSMSTNEEGAPVLMSAQIKIRTSNPPGGFFEDAKKKSSPFPSILDLEEELRGMKMETKTETEPPEGKGAENQDREQAKTS